MNHLEHNSSLLTNIGNNYFVVLLRVTHDLVFSLNLDLKIYSQLDKFTITTLFHL